MSWTSIVIIICVILAAFGVYRGYAREMRSYLTWRIVATIVAVIMMACLVLPINYTGSALQTAGKHTILLTAGFNKDSLKSEEKDTIYTLDKSVIQQYPMAKFISDASIFSDNSTIDVFGYGINKNELNQLSGQPIVFHPSSVPGGFVDVNWNDQLKSGETFTVQAKYKNTSGKPYKIILKGLNTTLDSVEVKENASPDITLKTIPKNTGRVAYTLLAINNKDTLEQEQLPLIISPVKPLKVLILSASPNFETKFLKTWLTGNGYGVASRSTVTKGKYSQEYVNVMQADLTHLSTGLLEKFDVLIGDLSLLKSLPSAENLALQQQVQKGMGVIVRVDSAGKTSSWLQRDFSVTSLSVKQIAPVSLKIQGNSKTDKLNIDPTYINNNNNNQTLVVDEHDHILASVAIIGAGKLVFTTVNNSHNWVLSGDKSDYYALWSSLINKAARKEPAMQYWTVRGDLVAANKPAQLVIANTASANNIKINRDNVYPGQDQAVTFQQVITYWPTAFGWQQAVANNGAPYWWYVWSDNSWKSLSAANKLSVTSQYMRQHMPGTTVTKQIRQKSRVIVPKIYFFILFLMAITFLWAESKFLTR